MRPRVKTLLALFLHHALHDHQGSSSERHRGSHAPCFLEVLAGATLRHSAARGIRACRGPGIHLLLVFVRPLRQGEAADDPRSLTEGGRSDVVVDLVRRHRRKVDVTVQQLPRPLPHLLQPATCPVGG